MQWYDYIILILSFLLIGVVLLQESKDDIKDAFSGEKSDLFKVQKQRGFEQFLVYGTVGISALFLVMIFVASLIR